MSLDIIIVENAEVVHNKNFYGFKHFMDKKRHSIAEAYLKEFPVTDRKTFIKFIEKCVDYDRQNSYINLIKSELSNVTVEIY